MLLPTRCPVCARPGPAPCSRCASALLPAPPGPVPALLAYVGPARQVVHALKFRNGRAVAPVLAAAMTRLLAGLVVDEVTWAPTSVVRRRHRGYDQAEVLARAVAGCLGVPCRRLLRRVGPAPPQTGRPRADRLAAGPLFVAVRRPRACVLVVDDVVTTGATLHAASRALLAGGAREVRAVAAAATPSRGPPGPVVDSTWWRSP